ncbi:MAG TPA: von Willebrand factor type A domain-containing protein [Thermoanaerobaculia bacterium]|nr:von Willebrand factor type A domain-containing protein [Thermoanaerobaculia bacterium]
MNPNDHDLERRLRQSSAPPPPEGLLERLKAEIPESLPVVGSFGRPRPSSRMWAVAASLLVIVGAGTLALRYLRTTEPNIAPSGQTRLEREPGPASPPLPAEAPGIAAAEPSGGATADERAEEADGAFALERQTAPPSAAPPPAAQMADASKSAPEVAGGERAGDFIARDANLPRAEAPAAAAAPPPAPVPQSETARSAVSKEEIRKQPTGAFAPEPQTRASSPSGTTTGLVSPAERSANRIPLRIEGDSYERVRRALQASTLPSPDDVRIEEILNHFAYGDIAPRSSDFAIYAEGGPAPFTPGSRVRLLRIGIRARSSSESGLVARNATASVDFNPLVVSLYRRIGGIGNGGGFPLPAEIRTGQQVSVLYEIKLQPDSPADQPLATVHLRYQSVSGERRTIDVDHAVELESFSRNWRTAADGLRTAAVLAAWGEVLARTDQGSEIILEDLLTAARSLEPRWNSPAMMEELRSLIERTVELEQQRRR